MGRRHELLVVTLLTVTMFGVAWAEDEDLAWFREHQAEVTASLPADVTVSVDETAAKEGKASLKVQYTGTEPVSITLAERPAPDADNCFLWYNAWIRSEDVQPAAYLEMLCVFDNGEFFSRARNQTVQGTTGWQKSRTPFRIERGRRPSLVKLGVRMEGPGTVWVDGMSLASDLRSGGAWGTLDGILGAALGLLGGLWGTLTGVLPSRGRARSFVLGYGIVLALACTVLLVAGILFLATGQPCSLWYPCILCGVIGVAVVFPVLVLTRRRYREAETRRMAAMDLTSGR